jgi:small subunit ribosomal protein S4
MLLQNSVCKRCRRENKKLLLKGDRCASPKCSFSRRSYAPGYPSKTKSGKISDYGMQLREKQKAKSIYGLREIQFKNYYVKASKTKEASGEKLIQLLETRLDNVVHRAGFTTSGRHARQMVRHGKFRVNGKKVDIPSYQLKEKDVIELINKKDVKLTKTELPVWLKINSADYTIEIVKIPSREEILTEIDEGLIVEFYSR